MKITAILVDDEENCLDVLQRTLQRIGGVEVLACCRTIEATKKAMEVNKPDILFLDVELQDHNGFELVESLGAAAPDIIFTTAYDQYALKAIKASALDYLMKPVDGDELRQALAKHVQKKNKIAGQLDVLMQYYDPARQFHTIALPTLSDIEFIKVEDVVRLHADGNYTVFYLNGGRKITVSKPLSDYEDVLSKKGFVRTHRSHIVNLRYVKKYRRGEGGTVVMLDGSEVEVSRQRKEEFLEAMQKVQLGRVSVRQAKYAIHEEPFVTRRFEQQLRTGYKCPLAMKSG